MNKKVSITQIEMKNYCPFRVVMGQNIEGDYRYGYQGENAEEEELGATHSFEVRLWDARIGRWLSVDPLVGETGQAYIGMGNNPVNLVDSDGRCPDCLDEVYVSLADHVRTENLAVGDKSSNGWEVVRIDENSETGYKAALYKGEYNGKTEYIYSTQGTNPRSLKDWENNAQQLATGNSPQFSESVEKAIALASNREYIGVSFTGHSLGGGLASVNALATEGKAVTFNAAGLSNKTKLNLGLISKTANISAYVVQGEIVSYLQGQIGIRAEGNITTLPASYVPQIPFRRTDDVIRTGQRIRNHMMNVVIDKFNAQNK